MFFPRFFFFLQISRASLDSQGNHVNIHKVILVLSVKLRYLTLKLPLEAASSMEPVLTVVMKDESC